MEKGCVSTQPLALIIALIAHYIFATLYFLDYGNGMPHVVAIFSDIDIAFIDELDIIAIWNIRTVAFCEYSKTYTVLRKLNIFLFVKTVLIF